MGIWVVMLIMNLIFPFTMIGFGNFMAKGGPKDINWFFGYRTSMSMKNQDTWEFAHKHCGKLWRAAGRITLPLTVAAMLFLLGREADTVGIFGTVIMCIQIAVLILAIIPTEIALRKNFDKSGNRKNAFLESG